MSDLSKKITALEDELENLRRQKMIEDAERVKRTPEQNLAIALHDLLCTWNHTNGCGWFYEVKGDVHDFSRSSGAHGVYLAKARKLSSACKHEGISTEDALRIFTLVNGA